LRTAIASVRANFETRERGLGIVCATIQMALVAHDGPALVQCQVPAHGKPYILSFGKTQYLVPASAIKSPAKKSNKVADGKALGQILATKAPEKWMEYCSPECLCHVQVEDSSCVYTTFTVDGHDDESRFLRFISGTIADRNFPLWKERVEKKIADGDIVLSNDRQKARFAVLNWTKAKECPNRAQLNPEINKWTALEKEEIVKSCKVDPEAKKRQLKAHVAGGGPQSAIGKKTGVNPHLTLGAKSNKYHLQTEDVVEWELAFQMGPKGTFNVHEAGNVLRIVQYKHVDGVVCNDANGADAAEAPAASDAATNGRHEEEEDDEDENDM
jgi:hypothetical protein